MGRNTITSPPGIPAGITRTGGAAAQVGDVPTKITTGWEAAAPAGAPAGTPINPTAAEIGLVHAATAGSFDSRLNSLESADPLILTPSVADHASSGVKFVATAGENVAIGDVCYMKSDGKYWIAKADVATTKMPGVVIAAAVIAANATGAFLAHGFLRDDSWAGWTVGQELFITITGTSTNTISATAPSATGNIVQKIGYAYGAKVIFFNPNQTAVEVP